MKGSNLLAFLGGAVVGGVVALLFAPKSGKETREQLRGFAEDSYDNVKDLVGRNVSNARTAVNKGVEKARVAINREIEDLQEKVCEADLEIKKRDK